MSRRVSVWILAVVVFGCATPQSTRPAVANEGKGPRELVCTYETPTGSHIPERICRFKDEVEQDAVDAQNSMRSLQSLGSNNTGAGGPSGR
jgi:hypothetical protein